MATSIGTREYAIAAAVEACDSGRLLADLGRRVAYRTESQERSQAQNLRAYLEREIVPLLHRLGFDTRVRRNPERVDAPVLLANRDEGRHLPTIITYGHGDVVRGYDDQWRKGLDPWPFRQLGWRIA